MLSSPSTHPPGMAALTIRYAAAGKSAPGTMTFASRDTLLSDVMVKLADTYRINVAESYLMSLDGKTLLKPNGTTACADTVGALIDLGIGTLARPVLLICRPSTRISNELAMSSTAPLSRVPTRNVVDCTLVEGIKTQLERDVEYMNGCARIIVPDILRHPYVLVGRRLCERSRVLVSDAESTTLALKTKLHKLNRTHVSFARTIATLKATDVPSCLHLCLALTVPPKFRPVAYASLAEPMTLLTYFHEPDTNDAAFADTVAEWTPKALEQLVRHTNFADVFQTKVNELETVVSGFIKSHLDVMNDDHQALAALTDSDRIASLKATVDLAHTTCRKSLQVLADGDGADMEHLRGCVEANTLKIGEMQSACDAVARDFSTFKTLYSAVSAAAEMVLARTIDVLLKGDNLTQIMEGEHTLLDKLFFLQYIDKLPRDYTLCLIEMARRSFTSIDDADECQRRQKFVDRVLVPRLHKNHSQEEGLFYALRDLECDGLAQYQFDQRDLAQHMEHLYMLRDAAGPESNCAANIIESVAPLLDQLETVARESSNERASQWMLVSSHLSSLDGSTPVAPVDTPNDEAVEEENAETKEAVVSSAGPAPDDDDSSFDREDSRPDDGDNDNKEDGTESDASFDVVMAGESIVAELREEVARVTLELDEARIELETQHEREKTRQCVFEKLSNDLTDELDRLQSQQDCRDQRIAELQAEQKRLTAAADHANEMRLDTVEANRGLQNAKNALAAEVSTLKASLSKAATTEAAVPLLEDQLRQAKAENDTLANEVEASRLTVEDLRADIADATSQMRYGKEQLAATEVTLAGLQKTVSALEEQLAESKRRCNVEEDDKTIALRSLERTTLQAQQAAADYEKRIKEVRAEGVAALAKQQREHNTALEVERQTHAAAYTAMTAEADEARAQAQRANEQLRTLEASVDSISVQMQSLMELAGVAPTAVKEEVQGPARIEEAIQKTSNQVRMRFDVIPALQGRLHDLESQSLECGKGSVEDGTISVGEVEVNQRMVAFPASSQSEAWMIFTESTKGRYAFLHDDAVRLLELNRPKGNGKRPTRAFVHILHYEDRIASPEDAIKYGVKPRLKIRIATVSSSEGIC